MVEEPEVDLSPVGCLALLWPAIPDSLVGSAVRAQLENDAAGLAPIARVAVELRLAEGGHEVDLHQYVSRSSADAAALKRHLSQTNNLSPGEEPARRFLQAWADDADGVRTELDGFFLEWDSPGSGSGGPPAIFLPVQGRHDRAADCRRRIAPHIDRLGLAGSKITELILAIPAELSISYVGFMLGRGEVVRVNLRGVRPDDLDGVLASLDWPGDTKRAVDLFTNLVGLTGRVAIALDFAPSIQPTIGFEAALPDLPALEPRWAELLDWLCTERLCTREKRVALERLGARLYPEEQGQGWPASWIIAAVRVPQRFVPYYERRLSHVKVSIDASGKANAKAYVSAQHHWIRGNAAEMQRAEIRAIGYAAPIEAAAARAVRFLITERDQDDFWRDFQLVNGASDEWVTAFIGYALVTSNVGLPDDLVPQTIKALLGRQRPDGGWGYNRISPADADSTAWVLKFLRAVSYSGHEVERAEVFLRSHLLLGGGVSTYDAATRISFVGAEHALDDSGWRGSHNCVAANVAGLIGEPVAQYLRSSQAPDGAWMAYWWRDDVFTTALAVEALGASEAQVRGVAWAARRGALPSADFDCAWLIRILMLGQAADRAQARALALGLATGQQQDGGWDASADMLFPNPGEPTRHSDMAIVPDHRRLFTAASALLALAAVCAGDAVQ